MRSIKTGEERRLKRKFQNYLFPFQAEKRKANLIFSYKTETQCSGQPEGHGMVTPGCDGASQGSESNLGCCGLGAPHRKVCGDRTTLSQWTLMFPTQTSSITDKTSGCGPILTCPSDPSSGREPLGCVPHSKAPVPAALPRISHCVHSAFSHPDTGGTPGTAGGTGEEK